MRNRTISNTLIACLTGATVVTAMNIPLLPNGLDSSPVQRKGIVGRAAAAELPQGEPLEAPVPDVDASDVEEHQIEAVEPLVALVAHGESETVGSYNAANNGRAMDLGKAGLKRYFGRDCSEVTIGEVMLAHDQRRLHAVGRYQIIGKTMRQAIRWAGLSGADLFTPANQDKLFLALIKHKRPTIWAYITGQHNSVNAALMGLAREWASMPTLSGGTYYGWGDRAHASVQEVVAALQESRASFLDL